MHKVQRRPVRLPAEWEPHQCTLMVWPHNPTDWPGKLRAAREAYLEVLRVLSRFEPVLLCCPDADTLEAVRSRLNRLRADLSRIELRIVPTNRSWIRDHGPITVLEDGRRGLKDFAFNGWARFPLHHLDNEVPRHIADLLNLPVETADHEGRPLVLEGGSIESNGEGVALSTRECLLSRGRQKRNPHLTQTDLESALAHHLGIHRMLWLNRGLDGDDTHGHVDGISRFIAPGTVLTMSESNSEDPNHAVLNENLRILTEAELPEIIQVEMPSPRYVGKLRLPASYANFYIANQCVLVPTFNDKRDQTALSILSELFPNRSVVGIHAVDLYCGGGGLHCITMQIPKG